MAVTAAAVAADTLVALVAATFPAGRSVAVIGPAEGDEDAVGFGAAQPWDGGLGLGGLYAYGRRSGYGYCDPYYYGYDYCGPYYGYGW